MSPIYGFGIYDTDEPRSVFVSGKVIYNQIYYRWRAMLQRCYDQKSKAFGKANVCSEWASYSAFKQWVETQHWEGLCLDKDILSSCEKVYSPETCAFVPPYINSLLNTRKADRGALPLGVSYRPKSPDMVNEFKKCYVAFLSQGGKQKAIGFSECPYIAHSIWQKGKSSYIENTLKKYAKEDCFRTDVADALTRSVWNLRLQAARNEETFSL